MNIYSTRDGQRPGTLAAPHSSPPRQRGIALLLVLGFIVVLAVLATAFATNMQVEALLARKAGNDVKVEWICRSGVELSKYILAQQMANAQEPYDSLNQKWAGGHAGNNGFNIFLENLNLTNSAWAENTVLGQIFPDQAEFEEKVGTDARCTIQIVDLERKFNINHAAGDAMGRFPLKKIFELMGVDTGQTDYLIDAIKDWRDTDDNRRVSGAESDTYEVKIPPYTAKNGPIDDLKELLLVEGITPEIYWGSRARQIAAEPLQAPSADPLGSEEEEEITYPFGMADIFTPISTGYINLNTAPSEVMQLVPGFDEARVDLILQMRAGLDGVDGTEDDKPFDDVAQIQRAGFTADGIANARRFFSVRSATYEVTVQANAGKLSRTLVAVLQRVSSQEINNDPLKQPIKILYTYWK